MKTITAIIILASVALAGCKDDRKCGNQPKPPPPPEKTEKVPDAPSTLTLSAIAAASVGAFARSRRSS